MKLSGISPLAAAFVLASCGGPAPQPNEGGGGTVSGIAASAAPSQVPAGSSSSDAGAAREAIGAKIDRVIASYRHNKPEEFALSAGFRQVWNRALGDGALDFDPLCNCQDFDPAKFRHSLKSIDVEGDRAIAKFDLDPGWNEWQAMTLTFAREGGDWLLDDIGSPNQASLRREMANAAPGTFGIPTE